MQHNTKKDDKSLETVAKLKYLGTLILDKNYIKVKGKLNSGNDFYHRDEDLLSSPYLAKILKIRIYKTIQI
jgi:nitrate reductase beta subunit